jgi:predicted DNA-binding protein with PD1-like motif
MSSSGVQRSDRSRHLVVRLSGDDKLPESLLAKLRSEGVTSGWLRASGVLVDVELRTFDARAGSTGQLGPPRRLNGPVHVLSLEGAIGSTDGATTCSLRAVLAREGDAGLELLGGEIASARAPGLEVLVTAFDDLALVRSLDASGLLLLAEGQTAGAARTWSTAVAAGDDAEPPRPAPGASGMRMPQKPARQVIDFDAPMPDAGDEVEHFAFGRCEVIKSDGDRLHLRLQKDGRIKEIALDMLRVTPTETIPAEGDAPARRRFKLDRRM